ncbi:MAG: hypothetical protein HKN29_16255 [Rhodothermales bacterium]|nr:hypothetical protein [Rhodothermales bacterium]
MTSERHGIAPALSLLSDVLEAGLTGPNRARLRSAGFDVSETSASDDEILAAHQSLFGFAVPPYAGVFLNPDGLSGGVAETEAVDLLRGFGLSPDLAGDSREHVSGLLKTVSLLVAKASPEVLSSFIVSKCLSWLPALGMALRREGDSEYADLLDVAVVVLLEIVGPSETVPEALGAGVTHGAFATALPDREPPLADPGTGVKDLAGYLTSHLFTGIYLGRASVRRLTRSTGSPSGFGGRALMMGNLLNSAASYGDLDAILDQLRQETQAYRDGWAEWAELHPALDAWAKLWTERLHRTDGVLETVGMAVAAELEGADRP